MKQPEQLDLWSTSPEPKRAPAPEREPEPDHQEPRSHDWLAAYVAGEKL